MSDFENKSKNIYDIDISITFIININTSDKDTKNEKGNTAIKLKPISLF